MSQRRHSSYASLKSGICAIKIVSRGKSAATGALEIFWDKFQYYQPANAATASTIKSNRIRFINTAASQEWMVDTRWWMGVQHKSRIHKFGIDIRLEAKRVGEIAGAR